MSRDASTSQVSDYLCIEPFLQDALQARTLQAAFELGLIERLEASSTMTPAQLGRNVACDAAGLEFLVQVLCRAGVVVDREQSISLTAEFRAVLPYRDLLLTKLQFAELVAPDFFARLPQLLRSADDFMETSKLFELFDYSRCQDITPQNCLQAARWMKLTTTLTRFEAPVCHAHFPFAEHQRMLDLGGNSGEFALQILRRTPQLTATVADLPVVCHVGCGHVANEPEVSRLQFAPLHFVTDALPAGHDLITFKSVLHDWPDELAALLIRKVFEALPLAGRILIFERRSWDVRMSNLSYGLLPVLLFFRSYRDPAFYVAAMTDAGFREITVQTIALEVPFVLVTGRRAS